MTFESLQQTMRENGIVGCCGAGVPSYAKLNKEVDTILINCAECEPLLRLHRQLIEKRCVEIMQTAQIVAETIGAKQVIVCIKEAYSKAVSSIKANIDSFPLVKLKLLDEVYPAGDEVVLIYEATQRVVQPGKLPASVGVIVYNVETMYNVYHAFQNKPVTHKFVTIAGEVGAPKTFYAPIGSKIYGLIKRAGGETVKDPEYLIGGPMMGYLGTDQDVVTKTTNAVIVLPKNHPVVLSKRTRISIDLKRAMASCCQCNYCTDMCPRHLLGHPINPAEFMRVASNQDSHNIKPYLDSAYCCGCGVCETYACPQGLSPRNLLFSMKNSLRAGGVKIPPFEGKAEPNDSRDLRKVPLERLISRLNLGKYNCAAPIYEDPINAREVVILTKQNVGVAAKPCVKVNDLVKIVDKVAIAEDSSLCVDLHASIDGIIVDVNERSITIRRDRE